MVIALLACSSQLVLKMLCTVLCKSNDSEFRRISCFVLNEISAKFRRTFALETCEISCRLSEISKRLTKFHRIFAQEKCEISFCFGEISESVTKFRRIFALEVCEISKGETKISFKMRTNFRKVRRIFFQNACEISFCQRELQ